MNAIFLLVLGLMSIALSLWARTQGSPRWRYRLLISVSVCAAAIYFILQG